MFLWAQHAALLDSLLNISEYVCIYQYQRRQLGSLTSSSKSSLSHSSKLDLRTNGKKLIPFENLNYL